MMKPNPRERKQKGGTCKKTREEDNGKKLKRERERKGKGEKLAYPIYQLLDILRLQMVKSGEI